MYEQFFVSISEQIYSSLNSAGSTNVSKYTEIEKQETPWIMQEEQNAFTSDITKQLVVAKCLIKLLQ